MKWFASWTNFFLAFAIIHALVAILFPAYGQWGAWTCFLGYTLHGRLDRITVRVEGEE